MNNSKEQKLLTDSERKQIQIFENFMLENKYIRINQHAQFIECVPQSLSVITAPLRLMEFTIARTEVLNKFIVAENTMHYKINNLKLTNYIEFMINKLTLSNDTPLQAYEHYKREFEKKK